MIGIFDDDSFECVEVGLSQSIHFFIHEVDPRADLEEGLGVEEKYVLVVEVLV